MLILDEMQTINWIPVSEKHPDDARPVLITYKWDDDDYEVSIGEFWNCKDEHEYGFGKFNDKVIAWAEMPRPYKEIKDGRDNN